MPGFILHLGAQVSCLHGGPAIPVMTEPALLLSGQPATTIASQYLIAGCAFPPPPIANGPCVTGQFLIAATRVLANGQPVLLMSSTGICAPTGTPLLPLGCQTRVAGI